MSACTLVFGLGSGAGAAAAERVGSGEIVDVPVAFSVVNVDPAEFPCPNVDGLPYTVRGRLEGPRSALVGRGPQSVTVYLHSPLLAAQAEWRFDAVPGYDFAREQAKAGHVSVTLDRLGYGESDIPDGNSLCLGSAADVANQVVGQLRRGDYASAAISPVAFERVAIAGFSGGGLIAEVAAYSFADVDALIVIGWAEAGHAPGFGVDAGSDFSPCASGGDRKFEEQGEGARGYLFLFRDGSEFEHWMFSDGTDADVVAGARAAHERDPCAEIASVATAFAVNPLHLGEIEVPVLLVFGARDRVYPGLAPDLQRARFTGSADVTLIRPPGGHLTMLDAGAQRFRSSVSQWLTARGF